MSVERHPIVSGATAGKFGPLRATSGCECPECEAWREARNAALRERPRAPPGARRRVAAPA